MTSYLTIDAAHRHGVDVEIEIKRSRFLTRLRRVATEDEARSVIAEQRRTHFDAAHNCTAFVLGPDSAVARSSDDGEPSGTAGVPMLNVLTSNHLTDVVAVVTRYFGGIKLGAGGLVRAYSDAVAAAVSRAGSRTVELLQVVEVDVDLSHAGQTEEALRSLTLRSGRTIDVVDTTWGTHATITVAVGSADLHELDDALAAISSGSLVARPVRQEWRDR